MSAADSHSPKSVTCSFPFTLLRYRRARNREVVHAFNKFPTLHLYLGSHYNLFICGFVWWQTARREWWGLSLCVRQRKWVGVKTTSLSSGVRSHSAIADLALTRVRMKLRIESLGHPVVVCDHCIIHKVRQSQRPHFRKRCAPGGPVSPAATRGCYLFEHTPHVAFPTTW
ncbi:hypothetical protein BU25DRAFT_90393 [Macroventuria anomochaeta]|uniref:Uncharacterized protein n=1 Tax=Macroventuria anomochaeta TaxID=301207 RepID=A0ACB6S038_9PLEO|nr:uncharacterized protein BU25DRAFT_90393 [Macroventuria anomochaeta]KAF2626559.1 hypothetical protein BU25DRAFT_90393 [Macroventuria anomochaeta]